MGSDSTSFSVGFVASFFISLDFFEVKLFNYWALENRSRVTSHESRVPSPLK